MQQISGLVVVLAAVFACSQARSITSSDDASVSGVIPSPNQVYGDESADIKRTSAALSRPTVAASLVASGAHAAEQSAEPSDESSIPIYVSPFARAERAAGPTGLNFERQESSHAPPNYAPRPPMAPPAAAATNPSDLKTAASYGKS